MAILNREVFDTLFKPKVLVERRKEEYNTVRPHSSLNYQSPAPEGIKPSSTFALIRTGTTNGRRLEYLPQQAGKYDLELKDRIRGRG
jgi:hypothetical protein